MMNPTRLLASVVVMLVAVAGRAQAQPLADRIPQDAVVYVGWSGSDNPGPLYAGSHLKAVVDASNLKELIDQSIPRLLKKIGADDEDAQIVTDMIATIGGAMWHHPSAFYFGGVDTTNPDVPMPKIALLCDAGAQGKQLVAQLDKLITKDGQPPFPYRAEEQDGLVVIAFGNVEISAKKRPVVPITQRKEFTSALAQVGKDPLVVAYIDAEGAVEQIDTVVKAFAPAEAKQKWDLARDALGVATLKRIIWTGGFDGKDWASQTFVEAPEPRAGLVKALLDAKPLSDDTLKAIPATATMAAAGHFDFGGFLGAVREMVKKIDAQAGADFEQGLDEVKQAIGMDLQADILDTLGDEWAVYSNPVVGGNGILGITVVNRLKDAPKAEKAFTQLEQFLNGQMKQGTAGDRISIAFTTTQQGDLTIHYLAIPVVAPAWAIKDGNLYVGLYPQVVSGAAEHVAARGKSILDNEGFAAVRGRVGGQGVTAVSYNDLPKNTADGYQEVLMLARVYLGMADLFGAQTPAMTLPTLAKLMPHVAPAGGVAWAGKDGWHAKSVSPFPGSDILASGGMGSAIAAEQAFSAAILLPSLNRSRLVANRVKSASNLRQIGQGMLLYANENKGKYPKTMGELLLTQDLTIEVFVNPATKTKTPMNKNKDEQALWVTKDSDYEYLGDGKTSQTPADVVVAHEKFSPRAEGVNMLFGDGHVEFMLNAQAQQMLARQRANEEKKKGAP